MRKITCKYLILITILIAIFNLKDFNNISKTHVQMQFISLIIEKDLIKNNEISESTYSIIRKHQMILTIIEYKKSEKIEFSLCKKLYKYLLNKHVTVEMQFQTNLIQ